MKVNEVISEAGIWQGIKNVGRGLGRAAGNAATGVIRGLDMAAGGTGNVGTVSQRIQRQSAITKKQLEKINKNLPKQALAYFQNELAGQGINLNDPTSFNPQAVRDALRKFALDFFAGGEEESVKAYITQTLPYEPLPNKLTRQTIQNYFAEVTKIRSNAAMWLAQNRDNQANQSQPDKTQQKAEPLLTQGVTVVNSADPLILRYKNTDFALTNDDRWVFFGSTKEASPEMSQFLNRQLSKL